MRKAILTAFKQHAAQVYPHEACGFIIKVGRVQRYWPCHNVAEDPMASFRIAAHDYAHAEDQGEITAVCHSHPDATSRPSNHDVAMCNAGDVPWHILSWPEGDLRTLIPETAPLLGRPWVHGTDFDCYGAIRAWYQYYHGITLPRFAHDRYWWEQGDDLYLNHYQEAGFTPVNSDTPQRGDVILMQIRSDKINHGAVYEGNGVIYHHPFGKLSLREAYAGYWQERTRLVVRYGSK